MSGLLEGCRGTGIGRRPDLETMSKKSRDKVKQRGLKWAPIQSRGPNFLRGVDGNSNRNPRVHSLLVLAGLGELH